MKITVIGAGYVGLVSGACLAEMGNHVMCLDVDQERVAKLNRGEMPIYEPGLAALIERNTAAERLSFTTDVRMSVDHGALQFIAVGTPPDEDGAADLKYVLAAARSIGQWMTSDKVIINKSTVPVGSADLVHRTIGTELASRGLDLRHPVCSNPEFLKEGAAIDDFMRPDRVVVGVDDDHAAMLLRAVYAPFIRNRDRFVQMDVRSAELTKYAANAMLAMRISFMNEMAHVAEAVGADVEQIRLGIGSDPRIGTHFLYAGLGYGGSCFPKDIKALIQTAIESGRPSKLLASVEACNDEQRQVLAAKVVARYGEDLRGKTFAMWGLSFKPETDDMRFAPSVDIIDQLLKRGARVQAYDPVATDEAKRVMPGWQGLSFTKNATAALKGANALLIATEWREFRTPDFELIKDLLGEGIIFDGRNLYEPELLRSFGIEYHSIGRRSLAEPVAP